MLLYTIASLEQVFANDPVKATEIINKNGVWTECEMVDGKKQVRSIFSTNPNDYLKDLQSFL